MDRQNLLRMVKGDIHFEKNNVLIKNPIIKCERSFRTKLYGVEPISGSEITILGFCALETQGGK